MQICIPVLIRLPSQDIKIGSFLLHDVLAKEYPANVLARGMEMLNNYRAHNGSREAARSKILLFSKWSQTRSSDSYN